MQPTNLESLEPLRRDIDELGKSLALALAEDSQEPDGEKANAVDLLVGELTMVALLLTNVDLQVTPEELDLINGIRQAALGPGTPLLESTEYEALCREFLKLYPERRLTMDSLPKSIAYLAAYDRRHGTNYADKARELFVQFGETLLRADEIEDPVESLVMMNYKDVLYSSSSE